MFEYDDGRRVARKGQAPLAGDLQARSDSDEKHQKRALRRKMNQREINRWVKNRLPLLNKRAPKLGQIVAAHIRLWPTAWNTSEYIRAGEYVLAGQVNDAAAILRHLVGTHTDDSGQYIYTRKDVPEDIGAGMRELRRQAEAELKHYGTILYNIEHPRYQPLNLEQDKSLLATIGSAYQPPIFTEE